MDFPDAQTGTSVLLSNNAERIPNRFNRLNKAFSSFLLPSVSSFHLLGIFSSVGKIDPNILPQSFHFYSYRLGGNFTFILIEFNFAGHASRRACPEALR